MRKLKFYATLTLLVVQESNVFALGIKESDQSVKVSLSSELNALNLDDYPNSARIFSTNSGRQKIINYTGSSTIMSGIEITKIFNRDSTVIAKYSTSLLLGGNDSQNNINPSSNYRSEDSHSYNLKYKYKRFRSSISHETFSIGKIEIVDVSADTKGNTGSLTSRSNIVGKNTELSFFYLLNDEFHFSVGFSQIFTTLPRIPYVYTAGTYRDEGDLQDIKYDVKMARIRLDHQDAYNNIENYGLNWYLDFGLGFASFDFQTNQNTSRSEDSLALQLLGGVSYTFKVDILNRALQLTPFFNFKLTSYDNNAGSSSNATKSVTVTGGQDQFYQTGVILGALF